MTKRRLIAYGGLILLIAGVFYLLPFFENLYILSKGKIQELGFDSLLFPTETPQKEISAPPPLRVENESSGAVLTRAGVVEFTNIERVGKNINPLRENDNLNAAAEKKAKDILAKQYFDHISPEGNGPDFFVSDAEYEYITIGENLALGNFAGDRELVVAWMESPGHRENILHSQFQEIGVAVARGIYEGKTTWVAVQEFGTPLSVCAVADHEIKKNIETNTNEIEKIADILEKEKAKIKKSSPRDSNYESLIENYNALVEKYNTLVSKTKNIIEKYNTQVKKYNACIESF